MEKNILRLKNIYKSFGETEVLKGLNLDVDQGEFITLLGSSGCGKTTTLRIIAGLESPNSGTVELSEVDVTETVPEKREVNTVFQSYALFPHMNIEANVGYGLKIKKQSKEEIEKAVNNALELVQLKGYNKRMPSELSGGQKQRVAMARALVNAPKVLLLDEPLGALDLQLRRQMQIELKNLQQRLGITFIYITHDQEEALNMSTKIGVMRKGVFEQMGTADEVYNYPRTSYVAEFVGGANILRGQFVKSEGESVTFKLAGKEINAKNIAHRYNKDDIVTIAVRSENIKLDEGGIEAEVTEASFAGGMMRIVLVLGDGTQVVASRHGINLSIKKGDKTTISFEEDNAITTIFTED